MGGLREVTKADSPVHLSYLPLAHVMEVSAVNMVLAAGGHLGFFNGNYKRIAEDLVLLRPTAFTGAPRVFHRFYQSIFAKMEETGGLSKLAFMSAYNWQVANLRQGKDISNNPVANAVFGVIRRRLGLERCVLMATGGAPTPAYLIEFMAVVFGVKEVLLGYGMTESSVATMVEPRDYTRGHSGGPTQICELKLVDDLELGYRATDLPRPRGEVWLRGPGLFAGYHKQPELTAAAMQDGWFKTGDIGMWNENGTLSIIDRKKQLFKLSQGEYISLIRVESAYGLCPAVAAVFVYGESHHSFCVGVVSPAVDHWVARFQTRGWWEERARVGQDAFPAHFAEVWAAHEAELKAEVTAALVSQEAELQGFEKVRGWLVESQVDADGNAWTPANGLMTPSMKARRHQFLRRYGRQLRELYAQLGEPVQPGEHWPDDAAQAAQQQTEPERGSSA